MEITVQKSVLVGVPSVKPTGPVVKRPRGRPRKAPTPLVGVAVTKPEKASERYVVFKNAMAAFGGGVQRFEAGTIIDDWYTIQQLTLVNADFIQPMDENTKITVCAHCNKKTVVR